MKQSLFVGLWFGHLLAVGIYIPVAVSSNDPLSILVAAGLVATLLPPTEALFAKLAKGF